MELDILTTEDTTVVAMVAPEDLKCGDFVASFSEIAQCLSWFWQDTPCSQRDELVRVRFIPSDSGTPLKVKAICLPFVFVKPPKGPSQTIDIRKVQLVRLNEHYGEEVWKHLRNHTD